jgi:hypothetical protein
MFVALAYARGLLVAGRTERPGRSDRPSVRVNNGALQERLRIRCVVRELWSDLVDGEEVAAPSLVEEVEESVPIEVDLDEIASEAALWRQ